jgi:hypothetical protein
VGEKELSYTAGLNENSMEVPQKLKPVMPYDPAILLLGIYLKGYKSHFNKCTCTPCVLQHYLK